MNDRSRLVTTSDWTPNPPSPGEAETKTRPGTSGAQPPEAGPPPVVPPRYQVERPLGAGGFGQVFLAVDAQLQRQVVLKVPHATARAADIEAALHEARVVAQLDHPGIVKVFDVGQTGDGRLFLVCQYIAGTNLAQRLAQSRPKHREAAALAAAVAQALDFAHQRGIVHRDIKPANILLDAGGVPFVADFGLALTHERLGSGSGSAGTPHYMSPEQASGDGHLVSGSSDIFSLGAVLYEMLTGRKPFPGKSVGETIELVRHAQPWPLRQLDSQVPAELERICLKALAKDPTARYATAGDLAADLSAFLKANPPEIRTNSQFRQRSSGPNQLVVFAGLIAVSAICLVAVFWIGGLLFWKAEPRNNSSELASKSPADSNPLSTTIAPPTPAPTQPPAFEPPPVTTVPPEFTPTTPEPAPSRPASDPSIDFTGPTVALPPGTTNPSPTLPPGFPANPFPRRLGLGPRRGQDNDPSRVATGVVPEFSLTGHTGPIRCVAFAREAALLVTGSDDQSVRLWDAAKGDAKGVARGYPAAVRCVAFTGDGATVAFGGDGYGDQMVVVCSATTQKEVHRFTWREDVSPSRVHGLAFSADGKLLAAASTGPVRVWDWRTKEERHVFAWQETFPSYAYGVAFDPAGKTLAAGCHGGGLTDRQDTVRLFDLPKNEAGDILISPSQAMALSHSDVQGALAFSPDGKSLARVSQGGGGFAGMADRGNLAIWQLAAPGGPESHDLPAGKSFALHKGPGDELLVACAAGSADRFPSSPFASQAPADRVGLWRPSGSVALDTGHKGRVTAVAFSANGKLLATASDDSTVKVWSVEKILAEPKN